MDLGPIGKIMEGFSASNAGIEVATTHGPCAKETVNRRYIFALFVVRFFLLGALRLLLSKTFCFNFSSSLSLYWR